jgi:transposase
VIFSKNNQNIPFSNKEKFQIFKKLYQVEYFVNTVFGVIEVTFGLSISFSSGFNILCLKLARRVERKKFTDGVKLQQYQTNKIKFRLE